MTQILGECAAKYHGMDPADVKLTAAADPVIQNQLRAFAGTDHKNIRPTNTKEVIKLCYSQKYATLTKTPVSRYITEACHWHINVVKNLIAGPKGAGFFYKMGKVVDR